MGSSTRTVDTTIVNGCVITVDDENRRYEPGSIALDGGRIVAVGDPDSIAKAFTARTSIDASDKVVLPGLINTHTHLFQTLLKGLGNELPLHQWIKRVPAASLLAMDERSLYLAALVGSIGALRSGTTTLLDYNYPNPKHEAGDAVLRGLWDSGIRALLGRGIADLASPDGYPVTGYHPSLVEPLDDQLADCDRLHELCVANADGRVQLCLAPPNMRALTPDALEALRDFGVGHECTVSMHVCESPRDDEISRERYGLEAVQWLDKLEVLSGRFVAVHCVRLSDDAISTFAERGVNVSYNPVSNMYVGNGVAPIRALREAGVRVTFGTDGAAVNNNDLMETIKFGSLLERGAALDPAAVTAENALRTATIEAARALGLGESVGSIEVGKKADLIIVDLNNARSAPFHDPVVAFAFSSSSEVVETVLVDGRPVVQDRRLVNVEDERAVLNETQARAEAVAAAAGWA